MLKTDVLIIGGGLAGLSCAYHLERSGRRVSYLVLEKGDRVGGYAGSIVKNGFIFDHTGHLLHLHDPYGKKLILNLLKGNLYLRERRSWIYSNGIYTRYPFQANTYGLPQRVIEDCVVGFLKTAGQGSNHRLFKSPSFKHWALQTFGEGICKHFMFPYNEKLWRVPLNRMTTEWQGRFVPKPKLEEVLYGSLTDQKKFFGYNAAFRYPKRGGIQSLPDALAQRIQNLHLGARVTRVDLRERVAQVNGVGEIAFKFLVNTAPLNRFVDLISWVPSSVREAGRQLRFTDVYCLSLGVQRAGVSDRHWIYFPEKRFNFYRVGFSTNFSPHVAPPGATSMYIELSRRPGEGIDLAREEKRALEGLRSCGILKSSDRLLARHWIPMPCAYVLYDFQRERALHAIFTYLRGQKVESIGRYGAWKYSFMEEAILDGKRCAQKILGVAPKSSQKLPEVELKPLK
ncbi:MAG: FAD-dependent oxidoreductase [Elusimicrobia bacterium]|nr:FAD-dependent oxidoreductase [Elusimicrobiota bacterium]